jgi:hypothetical protein
MKFFFISPIFFKISEFFFSKFSDFFSHFLIFFLFFEFFVKFLTDTRCERHLHFTGTGISEHITVYDRECEVFDRRREH